MDEVVERMPHTSESVRSHFLHQLRHLSDEMDLLARRIERFPSEILDAHPSPDEPSIKEYLGSLIERDREALVRLKHRGPDQAPKGDGRGGEEQGWDSCRVLDLLRGVQAGRNELVDAFEQLPHEAWEDDAREKALQIIRRDTNCLRNISRRFYESTLSGRYER